MNFHWVPIQISVLLILGACSGGFVVQQPPDDQIMFIQNNDPLSVQSLPGPFLPHPLPILPSAAMPGMKAKPFNLTPKSLPGSAVQSGPFLAPMAVGEVKLADVNTAPFDNYAKLRFKEGSLNYQCSAEFVGDTNDIIMTAGHCVYSNSSNSWNSRWRTLPKYDHGNSQADLNWECAAIYTGWAQRSYSYDYAFIKVRGQSPTALGLRGATLPAGFKSVGYPSNFYNGEQLVQVDGTNNGSSGGIVQMGNNPFGPGSSGGAWIEGNVAIGLNSFKFDNDLSSMWGPQFDAKTIELYEFVRRGCVNGDVSAKAAVKIENEKDLVIEVRGLPIPVGPKLTLTDDASCGCSESRLAAIKNETASRYIVVFRETNFGASSSEKTVNTEIEVLPGETRPLACTIDKDALNQCIMKRSFALEAIRKINKAPDKTGILGIRNVSPAYCSEMCSDTAPTGYCLHLGSSAKPILGPLSSFVSEALNKPVVGDVVATVADMVTAFNGDPKKIGNPCERSSFFRSQDNLANDGMDCRVTTAPLEPSPNALKLSLGNPTQTRATRIFDVATPKASTAIFSGKSTAPVLEFSGPSNSSQLNALFGGSVIAVQRVDPSLIVTTENGCVEGEH